MSRQIKLQLEALEERIAPSSTVIGGSGNNLAAASIVHSSSISHSSHWVATIGIGTYSVDKIAVDVGRTYHLNGYTVHFGQLGYMKVSGSIHSVGMIANGKAHGTLTFASSRGSVTIEITGPTQSAFAAMPTSFNFHVTSATGAYHSIKESATLRIDFDASPTVTAHGGTNMGKETGIFRINI